LLVDHAAQVDQLNMFLQARYLSGMLHVPGTGPAQQALCALPGSRDSVYNGRATTSAPCYAQPDHPANSTLDIFTVRTLLAAAGVELDDESYKGSGHSARYEGLTMMVSIRYYNAVPWKGVLKDPAYYYEVTAMKENAYGQHEVIWDPYKRNRTVIAMHGILVQASTSGALAGFSFNNLLLQFTASLALLTVASTGVNYLAMYVLKYRAYYHAALVDKTADFSAVAELEAMTTHELRDACRQQNLPMGGSRNVLICRLVAEQALDHDPAGTPSATSRDLPLAEPFAGR